MICSGWIDVEQKCLQRSIVYREPFRVGHPDQPVRASVG